VKNRIIERIVHRNAASGQFKSSPAKRAAAHDARSSRKPAIAIKPKRATRREIMQTNDDDGSIAIRLQD
jgi:hypothetical protein